MLLIGKGSTDRQQVQFAVLNLLSGVGHQFH